MKQQTDFKSYCPQIFLLIEVYYMSIYECKYKKNSDYETSDMGEYISVFTGNLDQVFIFKEAEIEMYNLFDTAISINEGINIFIDLYAESEADIVNIKNDYEDFLTNLIKNKILIEAAS